MQKNNGFSLIEVLVALTIFTVSLLGLVEAQLIAMRQNQHTINQAVIQNKNNNAAEELIAMNQGSNITNH